MGLDRHHYSRHSFATCAFQDVKQLVAFVATRSFTYEATYAHIGASHRLLTGVVHGNALVPLGLHAARNHTRVVRSVDQHKTSVFIRGLHTPLRSAQCSQRSGSQERRSFVIRLDSAHSFADQRTLHAASPVQNARIGDVWAAGCKCWPFTHPRPIRSFAVAMMISP